MPGGLETARERNRGAAGLMQKLLAFEFTSDTALFELFDKECPRLMQVTGIDIQDEVKLRASNVCICRTTRCGTT